MLYKNIFFQQVVIHLQIGTNLSVPVRPDQGGGSQVPERAAGVEPGGAQEPGLVELHRAALPHSAAEPEEHLVSSITVHLLR